MVELFRFVIDGLSESAALMDASDSNGQIRFVSNTSNGETATLDFYAWDNLQVPLVHKLI